MSLPQDIDDIYILYCLSGKNIDTLVKSTKKSLPALKRYIRIKEYLSPELFPLLHSRKLMTLSLAETLIKSLVNIHHQVIAYNSAKGLKGSPGSSAYSASKAALNAFNKSIAKEYARYGITSNIISLGFFDYGLFKKLDPKLKQKFIDSLPSKLMGSDEDVSSCFEYIVKSPFTNGETITIDGCMD